MVSIYVHEHGETTVADRIDPAWLTAESTSVVWVDLAAPTTEEGRLLTDVFQFHPLSVEDALGSIHPPKIEAYPSYLYLIIHGINFRETERWFATQDVSFLLGRNYLVTVHDGSSRSVAKLKEICARSERVLAEGPVGLLHRIIDSMVDNYRPEIEGIETQIDDSRTRRSSAGDRISFATSSP